jgi:membrane-bound lytic murein transglycosylase D
VWLKDVNDLKRGRKLRIGQKLFVPDRTGVVLANKALAQAKKDKKEDLPEAKEAATQTNEIVAGNVVYYIVQNGDNLTTIANEYDSSVDELRKMNKLSKRALLKVGMKLKVPKDEGLPTDPNAKPEESSKIERAEAEGAGTPTAREPGSESDYDGKQRINDKILYRVRKGENLTEIAKKYGMSVRQLAVYNDLPPRVMLKAGTRLEIPVRSKKEVSQRKAKPKSKFHVVRRGENLTKIADRYQISLQELKNANRLKSGSKVLAGMRLLVPL